LALITQNVDELHQRAGHDPAKVIEVHGTMRWTICWRCGDRRPMSQALTRVECGETDPDCLACRGQGVHGILKSDTISFGQALVPEVIDRALTMASNCDLLLAVGTSLQVFPIANAVPRARQAGAQIIIVNGEPTKMDHLGDVVLHGRIGEILPLIIG
jgi:NAD-dependent deacetylase